MTDAVDWLKLKENDLIKAKEAELGCDKAKGDDKKGINTLQNLYEDKFSIF